MRTSTRFLMFCCFTLGLVGLAHASTVKVVSNIAYGEAKLQTLDVHFQKGVVKAPIIMMVHGGAWSGGDKASRGEIEHKIEHWVKKGFMLVSINYRLLPEADPILQSQDVASALQFVQKSSAAWGRRSTNHYRHGTLFRCPPGIVNVSKLQRPA